MYTCVYIYIYIYITYINITIGRGHRGPEGVDEDPERAGVPHACVQFWVARLV